MISLMYKMYRSASQLILARSNLSNLRLGFRSILLFTLTITVDTSAQVLHWSFLAFDSRSYVLALPVNSFG